MFDAQSGGIIEQMDSGREIYLAAREFKDQLKAGEVKISPDVQVDPDTM